MSLDRCPDCDAPLATAADGAIHDALGGDCEGPAHARCLALCWPEGGACIREPMDWRARALAAEAREAKWREWVAGLDETSPRAAALREAALAPPPVKP